MTLPSASVTSRRSPTPYGIVVGKMHDVSEHDAHNHKNGSNCCGSEPPASPRFRGLAPRRSARLEPRVGAGGNETSRVILCHAERSRAHCGHGDTQHFRDVQWGFAQPPNVLTRWRALCPGPATQHPFGSLLCGALASLILVHIPSRLEIQFVGNFSGPAHAQAAVSVDEIALDDAFPMC